MVHAIPGLYLVMKGVTIAIRVFTKVPKPSIYCIGFHTPNNWPRLKCEIDNLLNYLVDCDYISLTDHHKIEVVMVRLWTDVYSGAVNPLTKRSFSRENFYFEVQFHK